MGAGSSVAKPTRKELKMAKRSRETLRYSMSKSVEKFIINVYATCPRLEAMHLILECKRGFAAFQNFLMTEEASELVLIHKEIILLLGKPEATFTEIFTGYEQIMNQFIVEGSEQQIVVRISIRDNCLQLLNIDKEDPTSVGKLLKSLEILEDEVIKIMARDQFFRFIQSRHYKKWRAVEASHAMAHTIEDAIGVDIREKSEEEIKKAAVAPGMRNGLSIRAAPGSPNAAHGKQSIRKTASGRISGGGGNEISMMRPRLQSADSFSIKVRTNQSTEASFSVRNFAVSAFENVDGEVIQNILSAKSWLSVLLPAVEALPLCFSLSMARKSNKSFPFIFVNHYFEKINGFTTADVLGKNASILLTINSERDQIQILNDGMKSGEKTSAVITTRTKNDEHFKNLLVTRPIFTEARVLKYVAILYMDVSREMDDYSSKTSLLSDLADMIPDTILLDADEEDDESDSGSSKNKITDVFTGCIPHTSQIHEKSHAPFMDH